MTDYEHELVVGSLDTGKRHVDDAVFSTYVRRVRESFLRETVPTFEEYYRPVVRMEVEYHAELFAGDRVVGTVEVLDVGTTSITTEITLATDEETVATAKTIQVIVDPETDEPTPVPEEWRANLT
ncbi:thioesterase family protein [Natronomonas gomsonensis]|uniref:acyl-CoA thioesterase n=1 Tax=Natronomonas gomsonensis TaxID=1046043 RepID=UPI0015B943A2|nr:thioesterase family protein [Natronomonas gomsonensis]